jgi:hypothetical protein
MPKRKKYGFSWSWKRASGLSAAKGKLSRQIGIPLTKSGRQRKAGKAMGCLIVLLIIISALSCIYAFSQDLPEYGEINELAGKQKVYVASEEQASRKYIVNLLKKDFTVVNSPEEAEFFLTYEVKASTESRGRQPSHYKRSEMVAYTLTNKQRKRILWSDDETFEQRGVMAFSAPNEYNLTKNFLKALKKAKVSPTSRPE